MPASFWSGGLPPAPAAVKPSYAAAPTMGANKQSVEKVMESMRHFFGQRPNSVLLGTFRAQDSDGSGSFELPEFKRALKSLNMDISEADMEAVFNSLDTDGEGTLALKEFLNELKAEPDPREAQWLRFGIGHQYVQPNREPPSVENVKAEPWVSGFNRGNKMLTAARRTAPPPPTAAATSKTAETALQMLRDFFSRRNTSSLLTLFQDVDQDDSGVIDVDEFGIALRQLNLHLSGEDIAELFKYFDKDGSGQCEIREILLALRVEPTPDEARFQRIGIGKQTLMPSRDVQVKGVQPSSGQSGFARSVDAWTTSRAYRPAARPTSNKPSVGEVIVQSMRVFLSQRPVATTLRVFRDQDADRSGKIERPEFGDAMRQLGMNDLSEADIDAAFAVFDTDGTGCARPALASPEL